MEPRFGHDFSSVRVHTNGTAAESAKAVSACAYTVGRDVVFQEGQYAPDTTVGRQLLAHELTHVVQQQQTSASNSEGSLAEAEASATSKHVVAGEDVKVQTAMKVGIQREEEGAWPKFPSGKVKSSADRESRRKAAAAIADQGTPLRKSVEMSHWSSEEEKQEFIQDYITYTRDKPPLKKQYDEAMTAFPDAGKPSAIEKSSTDISPATVTGIKAFVNMREPLPPDRDYKDDAAFVDNITKGHYDVFSDRFWVDHADGTEIDLNYKKILSDVAPSPPGESKVMFPVYWRDKRNGKIYPNVFIPLTAPNIVHVAKEIEKALPGAKGLKEIGTRILEMLPIQTKIGKPATVGKAATAETTGVKALEALRKSHPELLSLTVEEMMALRAYSAESWSAINAALRGSAKMSGKTEALILKMKSGLTKLPSFSGKVIRSESMGISEAEKLYKQGATISMEAFTSTTKGAAVAQREGNIALTIQAIGKAGKDISKITQHTEQEVLFLPGARFLVEKTVRVGDALVVTLKEL